MNTNDAEKPMEVNSADVSAQSSKHNTADRIYYPELDGLRFIAFLLVFIHHHHLFTKIPCLSFLKTHGWIGVDLFFVLSAFLFTHLLIAEFHKTNTISFRKFYARRAFRIWPAYVVLITISIVSYVIANGLMSKSNDARIFGLCTFTDNIMSAMYGYNPVPYTAHLWTIAYEEQFYAVIPPIILWLVRATVRLKIVFLVVIVALLNIIRVIMIAHNVPHPAIWVLPVTHFESIVLGVVIGFGGFDSLLKKMSAAMVGLMGIFFFVGLCLLPKITITSYWLIVSYAAVGLSTSCVLLSVLNSDVLRGMLSHKVFVFLGKRSYGLYLYHTLGNGFASYLIARSEIVPSNALASFIYSFAFTVSMSIVSYRLIETPFLRMKRAFEVIMARPI